VTATSVPISDKVSVKLWSCPDIARQ